MAEDIHVLVVDDDEMIVDPLVYGLEREGFRVSVAMDGDAAVRAIHEQQPDVVLLDVMLPKRSGFEVLKLVRQQGVTTPIIMLTARGQEIDKVMGLELGADDYVVKPFGLREVVARIRAVLRRQKQATDQTHGDPHVLRVGEIALDKRRMQVRKRGQVIPLSPREFDLLRVLMENAGRTLTRQQLLDWVWGEAWVGDPRTLDVHIHWLREKLEDNPRRPSYILTVRGVGYRFADEVELQVQKSG